VPGYLERLRLEIGSPEVCWGLFSLCCPVPGVRSNFGIGFIGLRHPNMVLRRAELLLNRDKRLASVRDATYRGLLISRKVRDVHQSGRRYRGALVKGRWLQVALSPMGPVDGPLSIGL
jgi:hypothetical protein